MFARSPLSEFIDSMRSAHASIICRYLLQLLPSRYLVLSDIDRKLVYVLSLELWSEGRQEHASVASVSEFPTPAAFLSFSCVSAGPKQVIISCCIIICPFPNHRTMLRKLDIQCKKLGIIICYSVCFIVLFNKSSCNLCTML